MPPLRRFSRARLSGVLGASALLLLLAVGILIGATVAWVLIAIPMTAIVLVMLADYETARERRPVAVARPARGATGLSSRAH